MYTWTFGNEGDKKFIYRHMLALLLIKCDRIGCRVRYWGRLLKHIVRKRTLLSHVTCRYIGVCCWYSYIPTAFIFVVFNFRLYAAKWEVLCEIQIWMSHEIREPGLVASCLRGRPFDSEGGGGGWHFWSGQIIYFHHGFGRKIYFRVNRGQNIYFQPQQFFLKSKKKKKKKKWGRGSARVK